MAFYGNEADNREKWRKLTKSFPLISELVQFQLLWQWWSPKTNWAERPLAHLVKKRRRKTQGYIPVPTKGKKGKNHLLYCHDSFWKKLLAIQHACSFRSSLPLTSRGSQKRPWESWEHSCWKIQVCLQESVRNPTILVLQLRKAIKSKTDNLLDKEN